MQADAVSLAEREGGPVQHPILDKVRAAASSPHAVDFFTRMLHTHCSA